MADSPRFLRFKTMDAVLLIHCEVEVVPYEINLGELKDRIAEVLEEQQCKEVVFDLGEVKILSSRLLALLAAVSQLGVPVWVESPSAPLVDLLRLTRYDAVIKVRQAAS